jgi:hypothetical protein
MVAIAFLQEFPIQRGDTSTTNDDAASDALNLLAAARHAAAATSLDDLVD